MNQNLNPEKNPKNTQLTFDFMPEIKGVFDDYFRNLAPNDDVTISMDESNYTNGDVIIEGVDNSDAEVSDPFADFVGGGLFNDLNTPVEKTQWEDLEDDVHR